MNDLKDSMVRATQAVRAPVDSFSQTQTRIRRRARNRRLASGAIAFVVLLGPAALLWRSFDTDQAGQASTGQRGSHAHITTIAPTPVSPTVRETISPMGSSGSIGSVAFGFGSLWASGFDSGGDVLLQIDPTDGTVMNTIPAPTAGWEVGGGGLAVGDGSVWVTGTAKIGDQRGAVLDRVDPAAGSVVDSIALGQGDGADVAVTSSDAWVLVTEGSGSELVRIKLGDGSIEARIPLDLVGRRVLISGTDVWVVGHRSHSGSIADLVLARIDTEVNRVATTAGPGVGEPSVVLGSLLAPETVGDRVGFVTLNPDTGDPTGDANVVAKGIHPIPLLSGFGGIWFVSYNPSLDSSASYVERLNQATGEVDASVELAKDPVQFVFASDSMWVANVDGTLTHITL